MTGIQTDRRVADLVVGTAAIHGDEIRELLARDGCPPSAWPHVLRVLAAVIEAENDLTAGRLV